MNNAGRSFYYSPFSVGFALLLYVTFFIAFWYFIIIKAETFWDYLSGIFGLLYFSQSLYSMKTIVLSVIGNKPALIINDEQIYDTTKNQFFAWSKIDGFRLRKGLWVSKIELRLSMEYTSTSTSVLDKILKWFQKSKTHIIINVFFIEKEAETVLAALEEFDYIAQVKMA